MTTAETVDNGEHAKSVMTNLLGAHLLCTLSDGRKVRGTFLCIDRLYVFYHIFSCQAAACFLNMTD